MGKRKVLNENNLKELVLPQQGEYLGWVVKMSGGDHVVVKCTDGETRLCRIRGKMKRRMWIRENDIVLVSPWDFDHRRADIVWRYIKAHEEWLRNKGYLQMQSPAASPASATGTVAPSPSQPTSQPTQ